MNVTRVFELLDLNKEKYAKDEMVSIKTADGWKKYSTTEFVNNANLISKGLLLSGIKKDDKVGIMSPNRPEWNFADFGIMQIGATQVPLYPTLAENDLRFILSDAEVKIVFVANKELYDKVNAMRKDVPSLQEIYTFDDVPGLKHWSELTELGKGGDDKDVLKARDEVKPDDLLTLIYTSGTTGIPKGVMLTHNNLVSNFTACNGIISKGTTKALSFLPMSHIFERMVFYLYLYNNISVYYAQSLETIVADIQDVKPHMFTTVPRLLEKVYDRIVAKGTDLKGLKKILFFWALNLGLRYELKNSLWFSIQLWIARKLIFKKWCEALGGNILHIVSGGAALQPRLGRVFTAAGMPVFQGYGLTETSPVTTVERPNFTRFGTSGAVIPGVEVKIAGDGEILVKGPNVMKGYYKNQAATDEVIDKEGWFHTGDIGILEEGIYLKITDRKKEMFKTAGGKYIAPQVMENKYKESPLIEQIMVIGENQRFPAALIVPSFLALKDWCTKKEINYSTNEEMVKNPQVLDKIQRELDVYNSSFGHWEQIKKFVLLPQDFSIDGGELTPKMSLKRKVIMEKYSKSIDAIYK